VNFGSFSGTFTLPPLEKIIGGPITFGGRPASGEIQVPTYILAGGSSQLGSSKQRMFET
jgi:hypothetical protein